MNTATSHTSPRIAALSRRAACLSAAACAFSPPLALAQALPILRLALPEPPQNLDPHKSITTAEYVIARALFAGLTAHTPNGMIGPGLAESWSVSADGLSYQFTLRDNLAWSDGRKLTAEDVAQSLARALDPATNAPFAALLSPIRNSEAFRLGTLSPGQTLGVIVRDARRLEIQLDTPSQMFLDVLAQPVAMAVPLHRIKQQGEAWAQPDTVIGNGPFVTAKRSDGYRLSRNARFFAASSVLLSQVDIQGTPDGADVALGFGSEPAASGALDVYRLIINVARPALADRDIRHALGMVVNRAQLIETLGLKQAKAAYHLVPSPPYDPPQAPFARLNLNERQIVAEALLLDVDRAQRSPFRYAFPDHPFHAAVAAEAQKAWAALGFRADLKPVPFSAYERTLIAGDFDVAVALPAWALSAAPEAVLFSFGTQAGPWNAGRYRESAFDDAMRLADADLDPGYRNTQYRAAEAALIEDQAAWPLFFYSSAVRHTNNLVGLRPNIATIHPLTDLTITQP